LDHEYLSIDDYIKKHKDYYDIKIRELNITQTDDIKNNVLNIYFIICRLWYYRYKTNKYEVNNEIIIIDNKKIIKIIKYYEENLTIVFNIYKKMIEKIKDDFYRKYVNNESNEYDKLKIDEYEKYVIDSNNGHHTIPPKPNSIQNDPNVNFIRLYYIKSDNSLRFISNKMHSIKFIYKKIEFFFNDINIFEKTYLDEISKFETGKTYLDEISKFEVKKDETGKTFLDEISKIKKAT